MILLTPPSDYGLTVPGLCVLRVIYFQIYDNSQVICIHLVEKLLWALTSLFTPDFVVQGSGSKPQVLASYTIVQANALCSMMLLSRLDMLRCLHMLAILGAFLDSYIVALQWNLIGSTLSSVKQHLHCILDNLKFQFCNFMCLFLKKDNLFLCRGFLFLITW